MNGWQEPKDKKRIYLITDNSRMDAFEDFFTNGDINKLMVSDGKSKINLGIHYYNNRLYSSNLVGICRLKTIYGETLYDDDGNELILKVVPRFNVTIVELLNYIREDDEFDRYLAPQTVSNRFNDKGIEEIDRNELFHFYENEEPLKVDDSISNENSIITVTVFLNMLKFLCKRPLMGRMLKDEANFTGKVKGKIVIEKNIRTNAMHGRDDRFYCQYLHYSNDIIENQILKAALKKAKRFIIDYFGEYGRDANTYAKIISYCSKSLRTVKDVSIKGSDCNGLRFSGCYVYYKPVISLAKMILDDISIESNGDVNTTGYVVPYAISMEKLFEVYVRSYLKKNGIHSYKIKADSGIRLERFDDKTDVLVEDESLKNPGNYISGTVKPDIILTNMDTGDKVVLDVKYKDYTNSNSRSDRLQLLAYCMMYNADHIGIVLPSKEGKRIFDARKINTLEQRTIMYHQLLLGVIDKESDIADYIMQVGNGNQQLLMFNPISK